MEARAPYQPADSSKGPRNLTAPLAAWLRKQGWTATEQHYATMATIAAHWLGPWGERFELGYIWSSGLHADATCQLQVRWPGREAENLCGSQRVRRLKEVRLLLLGNVRYHNARRLASPSPVPSTS